MVAVQYMSQYMVAVRWGPRQKNTIHRGGRAGTRARGRGAGLYR